MELLDEIAATPLLDVVRIVITNDAGEVLLVKETDDPNWKLPGGKIHEGETVYDATRREIEEELGTILERTDIHNVIKAHIPDSENYRYMMAATLDPNKITKTDEVAEHGFFDINQLPETKFAKHISSAYKFVSS